VTLIGPSGEACTPYWSQMHCTLDKKVLGSLGFLGDPKIDHGSLELGIKFEIYDWQCEENIPRG